MDLSHRGGWTRLNHYVDPATPRSGVSLRDAGGRGRKTYRGSHGPKVEVPSPPTFPVPPFPTKAPSVRCLTGGVR